MKNTDFDSLVKNVIEDLKNASNKEIQGIYDALRETLKKYDRDGMLKNIQDSLSQIFKNKKERCICIINDIKDSKELLSPNLKEELRKKFLEISNIHRTLLENIQSLLRAL